MKLDEIDAWKQFEYHEECACGQQHEVLTQGGDGEYETDVYVLCACGEYVQFTVPVN